MGRTHGLKRSDTGKLARDSPVAFSLVALKPNALPADSQTGDTLARIFQIEDFRRNAELREQCSCGAARDRQEFFSRELADLESGDSHRNILSLEDLHDCFPNRTRKRTQQWDYIYSGGLLATLPQVAARQVVRKATSCLKRGGHALFANITFRPGESACSACACRRWIYRTEYDMTDLARGVPDDIVSGQAVFRDAAGLNVYLELYRR
jgi:hypothetical protein